MGPAFLSLGDLQKAEEYAYRTHACLGTKREMARSYIAIGTISFCQGALEQARDAFESARQLFREIAYPEEAPATLSLG
jgi:tetratricopeptide (TPR) repeat protein